MNFSTTAPATTLLEPSYSPKPLRPLQSEPATTETSPSPIPSPSPSPLPATPSPAGTGDSLFYDSLGHSQPAAGGSTLDEFI